MRDKINYLKESGRGDRSICGGMSNLEERGRIKRPWRRMIILEDVRGKTEGCGAEKRRGSET
jgi:hypothetical protein